MKCVVCGSTKLRAIKFDNLDYIYFQINNKWILSNPDLGYFEDSKTPFDIHCFDCKNHFKYTGDLENQYSPAIDHKEITLDLDHTLVYVDYCLNEEGYDFKFKDPEQSIEYRVFKRNHLDKFINTLIKRFEKINIFTSATDWYANCIIENLNIPPEKLGFIKTRADTVNERDILFDRELMKSMDNSLMVEDKPLVIKGYNNTIFKVNPCYTKNLKDKELLKIIKNLNKKEIKLEKPDLVSGDVLLYLKRLHIKFKDMPFEKFSEIIKITPVSQEVTNQSPIHMKVFDSHFKVMDQKAEVSIIDLSYENYLNLCDLIKDYSSHKKMSQKTFDSLIQKQRNKIFSDF